MEVHAVRVKQARMRRMATKRILGAMVYGRSVGVKEGCGLEVKGGKLKVKSKEGSRREVDLCEDDGIVSGDTECTMDADRGGIAVGWDAIGARRGLGGGAA